jgi:hypothetical protein
MVIGDQVEASGGGFLHDKQVEVWHSSRKVQICQSPKAKPSRETTKRMSL